MLFNLVDVLQTKRRLLFVVAFIAFDLWLLVFCNQTLQTHRPDLITRIQNSEKARALPAYQSDVLYGDDLMANVSRILDGMELGMLHATVATTDGITAAENHTQAAGKALVHGVATVITTSIHIIGATISGTTHLIGSTIHFTVRAIAFPFIAIGHGTGHVFGTVSTATNSQLASIIKPNQDSTVPVITPEQAQQATLIQEDTVAVTPVKPAGAGGACDNGAGNGGYPMEWCDAPRDTVRTVSYSSDRINRECTSYAFWYFTTIEGHSDFHVTGNANRWARTSNYPVHATPAVGSIAVETRGYYGHVAIVQGLPGETHDGQVVPDGYVLVSEMNYDWQGHFRYSYSPLSKFSAYIYP